MLQQVFEHSIKSETLHAPKDSGQLFHSLFDYSLEFIGLLSPEGFVLEVNNTALDFIGLKIEAVRGKPFWETPWWNHSKKLQQKLKVAIKRTSQGKSSHFEVVHYSLKRKPLTIDFTLRPTILPDGNSRYLIAEGHNITPQKRVERLKKEQLFAIAHELKTPITVLKLISQSHRQKIDKFGKVFMSEDALSSMEYELDRLTWLINDVLDMSRIDTGKLRFNFTEVNLPYLIVEAVRQLVPYHKSHPFAVKSLADVMVIADYGRIQQVLINLITNAAKYSPEKKAITIDSYIDGDKVVVSITDLGIGIPKKELSLIFDKFYQVKNHGKGFGLGLFISKEIIKHHHGKIWVTSKLGKGSTFYFSLPIEKKNDTLKDLMIH